MESNQNLISSWINNNSYYSSQLISDEIKLTQDAEKNALDLFHQAAIRVPAYKDFLKSKNCDPSSIKNFLDLKSVPITTKKNYIDKYEVENRCWEGSIKNATMISTSSGTTGAPYIWPRDLKAEIDGAILHEYIFNTLFDIKKNKTLFINGFALGNWIAGTFTYDCCKLLQVKDYPLTVMSPGYSLEAVIEAIHNSKNNFDQVIIAGHTPFLKEIAESIKGNSSDDTTKIKLLGTGQAITEQLRDYLKSLLGQDKIENTVINLYGSADAALMGFETIESITLRRKLSDKSDLARKLFIEDRLPSIYNYDPRLIFFEEVERELVITKYSLCPLIRYNLHDSGGIISSSTVSKIIYPTTKLPFVYLFGRDKFMVKLYGANIYSEHMQTAFNHPSVQNFITGRYISEVVYDEKNNQQLVCRIELRKGVGVSEDIANTIRQTFIEEVRRINSEYNYIYNSLGEQSHPKIELYENGHQVHFPKGELKKNA